MDDQPSKNVEASGVMAPACPTTRLPFTSAYAGATCEGDTARWLGDSSLLQQEHPRVRILAKRVAQRYRTPADQAVACVEHVRSLPFIFLANSRQVPATQVVQCGAGDGVSKTTLLVGMLHSLEIPARVHFVALRTGILRGLVNTEAPYVKHCFAEVLLDGRWLGVDTYVQDTRLVQAARTCLKNEKRQLGYGLHVLGDIAWDARSSAFGRFCTLDPDSEPLCDWGVFGDAAEFQCLRPPRRGASTWAAHSRRRFVIALANRRLSALRSLCP